MADANDTTAVRGASLPTAQQVRETLSYDPDTGLATRRTGARGSGKAGAVIADKTAGGYFRATVGGKRHYLHRLVWVHFYGEWPAGQIDHVNGNRTDNRIANLRDVSHMVNAQNERAARRNNLSTGLLGVRYDKDRAKFAASITHAGKTHHLGRYASADEAHGAYVAAKRRLHQGCTL